MTAAAKRSPVIAAFDPERFDIGAINDTQIAMTTQATINAVGFIADVSAVRKRMIAGAGARQLLETYDIEAPLELLRWRPLGDDGAVAYVHRNRILVIAPSQSDPWDKLFDAPAGRHGDALVLPHEAADFALGGQAAQAVISELCAMNVADTADDVWIATRLANCEVTLRRLRRGVVDYRLLCSPADAAFLFEILIDAIEDQGGSIAGFNDYLELLQGGPTA